MPAINFSITVKLRAKRTKSVACLLFDWLLLNIFLSGQTMSLFVFFYFEKRGWPWVYSPYSFIFLCSSYISYYCWFLSGNFSFTLMLALPPNASFCWLKSHTVICGFPEREPPWSGGGGRLHSTSGGVGAPHRSCVVLEPAGVWGEIWLLIQASPEALCFKQKSALSN